jgi:tryptophan halogenase
MMINNITIVGGGSAGWMTATTLLNQFPNKKITLVESPNISNIGVGESTVPNFNDWLNLVDINYFDFMPHCDAVFKLGIAFKNWYRKDSETFYYPFGPLRLFPKLNDWHIKKIFYPETPISDYADCFYPSMSLINQNKSFSPNLKNDELYSDHAYQFDATKFGIWLRDYFCKKKKQFTHILAEVKGIPLNDDGIKYLILDGGQKLEADLFIDCTGFKSLLLSEFEIPFQNINNYIPNNYAWATKIPYKDPETQIVNYTNCTAIENGWIWEIPLFSRMGSGYVFSDKFVSSEEALKEFKRGLIKKGYENVEELEYDLIPMRCGIQKELWVKNVCAIGLSAGFIEPLQSNGLQNVHHSILNLIQTLERRHISEWDKKEFTTRNHDDFYSFAAIVAYSYVLSHRDDTEYWREIQNRDWTPEPFSPELGGLSKYFSHAYCQKNIDEMFDPQYDGLHCMTTGMNWNPITIHSIKYNRGNIGDLKKKNEIIIQQMEKRKRKWNKQVKDFPSPYQYLKDNIHN